MKLDATDLRYISADAFRVLSAVRGPFDPLVRLEYPADTRSWMCQVEQGSKNHELVPSALIAQIAGSRSGGVNKALGELAKKKLVAKVQNAKCALSRGLLRLEARGTSLTFCDCLLRADDGYRLTYGGYDFLACRTFAKRDTIYSVGNQIGTGKESGESALSSLRFGGSSVKLLAGR